MTRRLSLALVGAVAAGATAVAAGSQQTFRARVDAVAVPVSVRHDDVLVTGLTIDDFQLFDNGVPQSVTTLSSGNTPLDVTVVLDTSGSVRGDMLERLTAEARATDVLMLEDRLRLLTFGTTVHEAVPLRPIRGMPLAPGLGAGGGTTFFHAVLAALLSETSPGRPHLVVALSDGLDNMSLLGTKTVRDIARYSNVALHVVLPGLRTLNRPRSNRYSRVVSGWVPYQDPGDLRQLRDAAEITGGSLRTPPADQEPGDSLKQVLTETRSGYVLWYTPTGVGHEGWHDLTVEVNRRDHEVRARLGYFTR